MLRLPVRVPVPVKASYVKAIIELPIPEALPAEIWRKESLAVAVHAKPVSLKTTVALPAALPTRIVCRPEGLPAGRTHKTCQTQGNREKGESFENRHEWAILRYRIGAGVV